MALEALARSCLNDLVEKIRDGKTQLLYQSTAEVFQTNFALNSCLATVHESFVSGAVGSAIGRYSERLLVEKKPISTELLLILVFMLLDVNEYYYSGILLHYINRYFMTSDTKGVAALDLPYFQSAAKIAKTMNVSFQNACEQLLDAGSSNALEAFSLTYGSEMFSRADFKNEKTRIIGDITKLRAELENEKIEEEIEQKLCAFTNPLSRKIYSTYCRGTTVFERYVSSIAVSINIAIIYLRIRNYNRMGENLDEIREKYRKVAQVLFEKMSGKKKPSLGRYFDDKDAMTKMVCAGVPEISLQNFVLFHTLCNAVGHNVETGEKASLNKGFRFKYKYLFPLKRKVDILNSVLEIIDSCVLTSDDCAEFDKTLSVDI